MLGYMVKRLAFNAYEFDGKLTRYSYIKGYFQEDHAVELRNVLVFGMFGIFLAFWGGMRSSQIAVLIFLIVALIEKHNTERRRHLYFATSENTMPGWDGSWSVAYKYMRTAFYEIAPPAMFSSIYYTSALRSTWPVEGFALKQGLFLYATSYLFRAPFFDYGVYVALGKMTTLGRNARLDIIAIWNELIVDAVVYSLFGLVTASLTVQNGYSA
jgi:hypothetical protein